MRIKDRIYDLLVRKDSRVRSEYERYVQKNIAEHYENRLRHWKILLSLNWHYRVKKKNEPMLFWEPGTFGKDIVYEKKIAEQKKNETKKNSIEMPGTSKKVSFHESDKIHYGDAKKFAESLLKYDVISFDMFDTLVFRRVQDPKDLFWLIGNELHIPNYKIIRTEIEKEVREKEKTSEITIDEIYEVISERFTLEKERGIALELGYEKKVCFANPYLYEVYKILKENGKKVIVTSNMYLHKSHLQEILTLCGYESVDEIYVSCEYRTSKKNGGLQKIISAQLPQGCKVVHIGDNYYMDVEGARIAGWKAVHYKNVNKMGALYRTIKMAEVSGSIYKGIVNAKLYNGVELNPYYEYGYANVGYLVYGFCKWLNCLAAEKKIDKFLFCARDMSIVSKAYNEYFGQIDSEYIKASRTSSIHLSFERHTQHFVDWHIKRRISSAICMSQVLRELKLEYLIAKLPQYDLLENEVLTRENCNQLKEMIFDNKQEIINAYENEKKAAQKYYAEKIGNSTRICIVDMGWKGSTANSLDYFLKEYCGMNIEIFSALLGMEGHGYVDELLSLGKIYSYMFSSQDNTDIMENHNTNGNIWRRIYEIIFTSEEQSLLNFDLTEDGNIEYVYLRKEFRQPEIVQNIHRGIMDFIHDYSEAEKNMNLDLQIPGREGCKPLQYILKEKEYNLKLFGDFEVCFIAGDVKEDNMELFSDVVKKGGK